MTAANASRPDVCQPHGSAELAMLDVYMPMMKSAALIAAGQLGVFQALADGPLPLAELARRTASSERGMADLSAFLVSLGFLEDSTAGLANTASTQRWFTRHGQVDYTAGLLWTQHAWSMMGELAAAVRRGGPDVSLWQRMVAAPALGHTFSAYMAAFAADLGPDLLRHVPVLTGQNRLLDLGGSHGLHSIRFCQQHPQLSARIVDFPSALGNTGQHIADAGLSERIELQPGNLLDADWGDGYDIVLYLSVAHNHSPAQNQMAFQRIQAALRPGGLLVIHEYIADPTPDPFTAAFRLTLCYETGTQPHSDNDYRNWLQAAGFTGIERIDLDPREKGSLLLARR